MTDNKKDNSLKEKMARARQAMGGVLNQTRKTKRKIFENRDRQRAIRAMENKGQQEKRALSEEVLLKRRLEAQKAMASPTQRANLEQTNKRDREIKAIKEKLEQVKLLNVQKEKEKENQEKNRIEKLKTQKNERQNKYLKHLQQTNKIISTISQSEKTNLERFRTLKTDSHQTVVKNNLSVADIAIKENQKENASKKEVEKGSRKNKILIIIIILFMIFLSFGIIYLAINLSNQFKTTDLTIDQSIIFAEEHKKIDVTDLTFDQVYNILTQNIAQEKPLGSISHIYFTKQQLNPDTEKTEEILLPTSDLLDNLNINTPLDFKHFLTNQYMFGTYNDSDNLPFLIFETTSFANTLNTLLKNETMIISSILGTLNPQIKNKLLQAQFSDKIIKNVDTRIAIDYSTGETLGLYAFFDQNIVIFTQNEKVLGEIIERLKAISSTP